MHIAVMPRRHVPGKTHKKSALQPRATHACIEILNALQKE
jgi:hypothetical protein